MALSSRLSLLAAEKAGFQSKRAKKKEKKNTGVKRRKHTWTELAVCVKYMAVQRWEVFSQRLWRIIVQLNHGSVTNLFTAQQWHGEKSSLFYSRNLTIYFADDFFFYHHSNKNNINSNKYKISYIPMVVLIF